MLKLTPLTGAIAAAGVILAAGFVLVPNLFETTPKEETTQNVEAVDNAQPGESAPPHQIILQRLTDKGLYRVALKADVAPLPLRNFHTWHARVSLPSGQPVVPRTFKLRGGMPGHGHGLPTSPSVTPTGSPGEFLIEGIKFNMAGRWVFAIEVAADNGADNVVFEFDVSH